MGDFFKDLQADKNPLNNEERGIVDSLFPGTDQPIDKKMDMVNDLRTPLIIAFVYALFSLPMVQDLLVQHLPQSDNPLFVIAIKALLFAIIIYALSTFGIINLN